MEMHASEKTRVEQLYEKRANASQPQMRRSVAQRSKLMISWTVEIPVNSRPRNLTWLYWELSNARWTVTKPALLAEQKKKSTVYKNGILLPRPKNLHENISLSTVPPH